MPRTKRATNAELDQRIDTVATLLLNGARRGQILKHASDQGWGVVPRQIDTYMRLAHERIAQEGTADLKSERAIARRRMEMIFMATMSNKDYGRALATVREIVNLLGLAAPPPARTLNLNVDTMQLETLISAIDGAGLSASDVFAAMIEQLASTGAPVDYDLADDEGDEDDPVRYEQFRR